jgi:hypothetical protein
LYPNCEKIEPKFNLSHQRLPTRMKAIPNDKSQIRPKETNGQQSILTPKQDKSKVKLNLTSSKSPPACIYRNNRSANKEEL